MIRFLIIIFFLALAYLGITAISKYDATISVLVFDYKISISMFILAVMAIMIVSISSLGFRIIGMIFKMPYVIAEKLAFYKRRSRSKLVIEAYGQVVIGNLETAERIISKIDMKNIDPEYKEHVNLLAAICNQDFDKNMPMLQTLLSNKEYHDFAAKLLAKKLFDQGYHAQSMQYAEQVRSHTNDPEIMYLLIRLYANLDMWEKFDMVLDKYVGIYPKQAQLIKEDLSHYYFNCAKFTLSEGSERKAIEYLEKSLEYNPVNQEAIEMFCAINLTLGHSDLNLELLEQAFSKSPSFAIFELYHHSSDSKGIEIYKTLSNLVDVIAYRDVFFAIAAYLDLSDEIKALRYDSEALLLR